MASLRGAMVGRGPRAVGSACAAAHAHVGVGCSSGSDSATGASATTSATTSETTTSSAGGAGGATTGTGGATTGTGGAATGSGGGGGAGGAGGASVALDWYACPLLPGQNAECAKPDVPLDWDHPATSRTIPYLVKRVPAATQPARGQVWILQGGPGFSGGSIEGLAPMFQAVAADLDVYIPDHRGTGFSGKLDCPALDAVAYVFGAVDPTKYGNAVAKCVQGLEGEWGADLGAFSSTGAGRDVGELIARTRQPGQEAYVYGVSYGTRWAHRYLQQFPTQATGVIFDSIVEEDVDWFDGDATYDATAKQIFDACGEDAFCSGKLGADPWGALGALMTKLDTPGTCATSMKATKSDYKALFAALLTSDFATRALMPALAYRIDRCDEGDQAVIELAFNMVLGQLTASAPLISTALHFNVVYSELVKLPAPSADELAALDATFRVSSGGMVDYRAGLDAWPAYPHDAFLGAYASTTTPILMMNGTLDGQTPLAGAQTFASHYAGANQTFVKVDRSGHAVIQSAPIDAATGATCGMALVGQFLTSPTKALDTSCSTKVLPLDFEQASAAWPVKGGPTAIWENVAPVAKLAKKPVSFKWPLGRKL